MRDGEWQHVSLRAGSLEFGINNDWRGPPGTMSAIRLVAVGEPGEAALLELRRAEVFALSAAAAAPMVRVGSSPVPLEEPERWRAELCGRPRDQTLHRYMSANGPKGVDDQSLTRAEDIRERGVYRLGSAVPVRAPVGWSARAKASEENEWRFRWHALEASRLLLDAFRETDEEEYLHLAREHAGRWIDENLRRRSDDERYAWYDHGTASRTMSLLALWDIGQERGFDVLNLVDLLEAIRSHGELLASDTFVARNQPYRAHNHALFQAIALLFVGRVAPLVEGPGWAELGAERCLELVSTLVNEESICVENSSDYHTGLATIVGKLSGAFEAYGLDGGEQLVRVHDGMRRFEAVMRYPNGTSPAMGDSWHFTEAVMQARITRSVLADCPRDPGDEDRFYPAGGYAVLRGGKGPTPTRQLNLVCSAANITHKHADQLAVTFWADGIEWLADPGLYKYGATDEHAAYFRHARAHNAVVLDGATYPAEAGNARLLECSGGEDEAAILAEHRGYEGAVLRREVRYDKVADLLLLLDRVEATGEPRSELWFHAGLGVEVAIGDRGDVLMTHPEAPTAVLIVPARPRPAESFRGQTEPSAAGWMYTRGGAPVATWSWRYVGSAAEPGFATHVLPADRERLLASRERLVEEAQQEFAERPANGA